MSITIHFIGKLYLLQKQGKAAYKKAGKDVTAINTAMALAKDWEEIRIACSNPCPLCKDQLLLSSI